MVVAEGRATVGRGGGGRGGSVVALALHNEQASELSSSKVISRFARSKTSGKIVVLLVSKVQSAKATRLAAVHVVSESGIPADRGSFGA